MNNKIDKNFFKQIIVIFLVILAANYAIHICLGTFSQKAYQKYYSLSKINMENQKYNKIALNELFTNYKPHIDTNNYPKTFQEYIKSNKKKDNLFSSYDNYTRIYSLRSFEETKSRKEIINLLDNKHKYRTKKQNIKTQLYPFIDSRLFFNQYGDLIFIQIEKGQNKFYRYDIKGNLVEAEWYNGNEVSLIYSPDKLIKYMFYHNFSNNFQQYRITFKQYCQEIHQKIISLSIIILVLITIFIYLKKNMFFQKVDNNYIQELIINNSKLKKYKTSIWSHLLAIIGWIYLYNYINLITNKYAILYIGALFFITILSFIIVIPIAYTMEILWIKRFKLKWKFIYENKIYNIFWLVGITVTFITIISAIITTFLILTTSNF